MGLYDTQIAAAQAAQDKEKGQRQTLEAKRIQCAVALRPYIEKLFADRTLEQFLFNGNYEIPFLSIKSAVIDTKRTKADISYSITGLGITKRIDADVLLKEEHYFFGKANSVNALVFELASVSNGEFTSDLLEQKVTAFLEEKQREAGQ